MQVLDYQPARRPLGTCSVIAEEHTAGGLRQQWVQRLLQRDARSRVGSQRGRCVRADWLENSRRLDQL